MVPEGVDDSFGPETDEAVLTATRKRFFGEGRPYLLFVGKLSDRRNTELVANRDLVRLGMAETEDQRLASLVATLHARQLSR